MDKKNIIIVLLCVIVLILAATVISGVFTNTNKNTTNMNTTVENTTNDTINTTDSVNTTNNTNKTNPNEPQIVSKKWVTNHQAGDGSLMLEVTYSDGNFRQYDKNGKLIGSSFESDQKYLPQLD